MCVGARFSVACFAPGYDTGDTTVMKTAISIPDVIFEEAERAGRIVKNLLVFASGKKPEHNPVNLNEIVERTLALRAP